MDRNPARRANWQFICTTCKKIFNGKDETKVREHEKLAHGDDVKVKFNMRWIGRGPAPMMKS